MIAAISEFDEAEDNGSQSKLFENTPKPQRGVSVREIVL
jgi:hypothetical protein